MSNQLRLDKDADPVPHTPGPWRVARKAEGHGWTIVGPSPREHDRPMEWFIARTVSDEPEDEANVRLISRAPELFDALTALLKNNFERGYVITDAVSVKAVELLRQAEGR